MLRYAITNGEAGFAGGGSGCQLLVNRCGELAREGVEFILVREKALAAGQLKAVSREVVKVVREAGSETRVVVAGRVDVAFAVGADGVHLGSGPGELRVSEARKVFPRAFVSVSCHSLDAVRRARAEGASAILFAPVFGKWAGGIEVVAGVGLERLQRVCATAGEVPVFALGGITEANAERCRRVGAAGVAGIRMFFGA